VVREPKNLGNAALSHVPGKFLTCFFIIQEVATCDSIITLGSSWYGGQSGTLNLVVPSATTSWTIVLTFDKPLTSLDVFFGTVTPCTTGGFVCSFTNEVSISSTCYEQLLRAKIPKAQKKTVKLSSFFMLLGYASVKAACRTLMKLTHAVTYINYINILRTSFFVQKSFVSCSFFLITVWL